MIFYLQVKTCLKFDIFHYCSKYSSCTLLGVFMSSITPLKGRGTINLWGKPLEGDKVGGETW